MLCNLPHVRLSTPAFFQMPSLIAATVASDKPTDGYITKDIISILAPTAI